MIYDVLRALYFECASETFKFASESNQEYQNLIMENLKTLIDKIKRQVREVTLDDHKLALLLIESIKEQLNKLNKKLIIFIDQVNEI